MKKLSGFLEAFFSDESETICLRQLPARAAPPHILGEARYLQRNIETARRQLVDGTPITKALRDANKKLGLYFVVNAGGHDDKSIKRFNAFFVEDDAHSIEEQRARLDAAPLATSIRVETKKSVHAYWLIEGDVSREDWQEIQGRLIAYFGGDPTIKNPSRVMRLPGFDHVSYVPADDALAYKPVTLDQFEPQRRYTVEQMRAAFPPVAEPVRNKAHAPAIPVRNGAAIPEGQRNASLASIAGGMRARGAEAEEIAEELQAVNLAQCSPPLDQNEVSEIARSVSRYAPGQAAPYRAGEAARGSTDADADTGEADFYPLSKSWADFAAETYPQGERIAFAVERGEIALVNALPNAGKTTLALNAALSLAAGLSLHPIVGGGKQRRVLYVDGETRRARLQRDLLKMSAREDFDRETAMTVGRNLHVICEAEIRGESLSITRTDHLLFLSAEAIRVKPDLIVVDTLSSLCPVFNENDNAEQTRKVWRPLQKLARDCDAAILVLHHVGKRGSEEGQTPERVYRGRGASAAGGAARAVWLLIPDATTPGLSTLSCVKAKGDTPSDVRLKLDPKTRWFGVEIVEAQPVVTPLEKVLTIVDRQMTAGEIKAALKATYKPRAVESALAEALQLQKLRSVKKGVYAPLEPATAQPAQPATGDFADDADDADAPENDPPKRQPHDPQTPIGRADRADTTNSNKSNGLGANPQRPKKRPVRMRADAEMEVGEL